MLDHLTPLADWVVILPVFLGLMGGALLLMLRRTLRVQPVIAVVVLLLILASDVALFSRVLADGPLSMTMGNWLPPFGISFTADVMGAGFALAAAFVALCVVLYLAGDAPESAVRDGVYPLVLLLVAGVSGGFLTGDLFNLYVWFEVMLIASFGLIVIAGNRLQLDGAVKYGVINIVATALFLTALGLLYGQLGTLNMADIIGAAQWADPALLAAIAALFALAFGTKAAAFPVNSWLAASYHAPPAAISALLGGLLTKVGVYALLRTLVMLWPGARDTLSPVILVIAIATAIMGPLSAIAETGLRRAIGFILIGGVGIALLALTDGQHALVMGGIAYTFASMLTLAALYLVAALVERLTGATDSRNMGGLYTANSLVSILFLVLVLTVAGIPPFLAFWPKLLLLQGFIETGMWVAVFAILGNALLTLIGGARLWARIFWRGGEPQGHVRAISVGAATLLTGTIVIIGLWPGLFLRASDVAATDLMTGVRYVEAVGVVP